MLSVCTYQTSPQFPLHAILKPCFQLQLQNLGGIQPQPPNLVLAISNTKFKRSGMARGQHDQHRTKRMSRVQVTLDDMTLSNPGRTAQTVTTSSRPPSGQQTICVTCRVLRHHKGSYHLATVAVGTRGIDPPNPCTNRSCNSGVSG
jgi:hypothetical protein